MEYKEVLDKYGVSVERCIELSHRFAGIQAPTARHYYASVLFTRLCTLSYSLWELLPFSPRVTRNIDHWDCVTIASMVRNIIEAHISFYYLCIDNINESEWNCRWSIFNLHDCTSRANLFDKMGDEKEVRKFERQRQELKASLLTNSFFCALPDKHRKGLLKGKEAFILSKDDLAERMGLNKTEFRWKYNFLSLQIHCLPMSFYRMGDQDRGRGIHSELEEAYIKVFVEWAIQYLEKASAELELLFTRAVPSVG